VVLPSAVRRELDLKPGTHMLLSTEKDGSLRLRPYRAVAEQSRGLLRDLPGESMVDDLITQRRAEALQEDTE
jgi:AbrB family looped-hinge helix DNA binding protein